MVDLERLGGEDTGQEVSPSKVAFASSIGATIEWYDFFIYGTAAALVFGQLFFTQLDPVIGTIVAFGTFAVGYLARPLGAFVFGHYGDRIGRKTMLIMTLFIMGVATFLIGLLPTYNSIGVWAPILLVTALVIRPNWHTVPTVLEETADVPSRDRRDRRADGLNQSLPSSSLGLA